ncbi:MAG: hypothetical protein ABI439_01515 [Rhodospirillales bacterium]
MLSGRELALGIVGAWRLVRADRSAMLCFDLSPRGFWRSFWLILLLAPLQALLVAINLTELGIDPIPAQAVLLEAGIYVLDWLLLPAVLSEIALRRGRIPQFASFTIAYNYAQVLLGALWLTVIALSSLLSPGGAAFLQLGALGLSLFYQYRIARIAFELERPLAAMVVLLSLALSLTLQYVNASLLQPFIPGGT